MKMWCAKFVLLFALGASVLACSKYKDCLSCTFHSDSCLFIGLDDEFNCINKVEAYLHEFDYVAEMAADCEASFDDYLSPTQPALKQMNAYDHSAFTESAVNKSSNSTIYTNNGSYTAFSSSNERLEESTAIPPLPPSNPPVELEETTTEITTLPPTTTTAAQTSSSSSTTTTSTTIPPMPPSNPPVELEATPSQPTTLPPTTTIVDEEDTTFTGTTKNEVSSSSPSNSSYTSHSSSSPILSVLSTSSTPPPTTAKKTERTQRASIQVKIFPPDLAATTADDKKSGLVAINNQPVTQSPKTFPPAKLELRQRYFSKDGLFNFEIPAGPITCNIKDFKNRRHFVQFEYALCLIGRRLSKVNQHRQQRQSIITWQSANPATSFNAKCQFLWEYKKICHRF